MTSGAAQALSVTAETEASALASSLAGPGVTVTNSSLSGQDNGGGTVSTGTYTNASGTYSIGSGVVISTGNVLDYEDGPNAQTGRTTGYGTPATPAQDTLLTPISQGFTEHLDVTQLDLTFDVGATTNKVFFNAVFGSEEYPEFVGSKFIDGFAIYLNGVNIAQFNSKPINIDHPDFRALGGTELDGVLDPTGGSGNPVMLFEGAVTPGSTGNTLTFIIGDTSDDALDTTVYLSGFGVTDPGGGTPGGGVVPIPASLPLMGSAVAALGLLRRKK